MRNPPLPLLTPTSDYGSALRAIVDRKFQSSYDHERQLWRAQRAGAHPAILEFELRFMRRMRMHGVPMFAHSMVRSNDDQNALFVQGVSKARGGESPHNFGLAVDLVHGRQAWNMDRRSWEVIGHIGKEIAVQAGLKLDWGGDWKFWDPAHWQVTGWRELAPGFPFSGAW